MSIGDCWSGLQSSMNNYGIQGKSKACIARDQEPCEDDSGSCVGENGANFVYELTGIKFHKEGSVSCLLSQLEIMINSGLNFQAIFNDFLRSNFQRFRVSF